MMKPRGVVTRSRIQHREAPRRKTKGHNQGIHRSYPQALLGHVNKYGNQQYLHEHSVRAFGPLCSSELNIQGYLFHLEATHGRNPRMCGFETGEPAKLRYGMLFASNPM